MPRFSTNQARMFFIDLVKVYYFSKVSSLWSTCSSCSESCEPGKSKKPLRDSVSQKIVRFCCYADIKILVLSLALTKGTIRRLRYYNKQLLLKSTRNKKLHCCYVSYSLLKWKSISWAALYLELENQEVMREDILFLLTLEQTYNRILESNHNNA